MDSVTEGQALHNRLARSHTSGPAGAALAHTLHDCGVGGPGNRRHRSQAHALARCAALAANSSTVCCMCSTTTTAAANTARATHTQEGSPGAVGVWPASHGDGSYACSRGAKICGRCGWPAQPEWHHTQGHALARRAILRAHTHVCVKPRPAASCRRRRAGSALPPRKPRAAGAHVYRARHEYDSASLCVVPLRRRHMGAGSPGSTTQHACIAVWRVVTRMQTHAHAHAEPRPAHRPMGWRAHQLGAIGSCVASDT